MQSTRGLRCVKTTLKCNIILCVKRLKKISILYIIKYIEMTLFIDNIFAYEQPSEYKFTETYYGIDKIINLSMVDTNLEGFDKVKNGMYEEEVPKMKIISKYTSKNTSNSIKHSYAKKVYDISKNEQVVCGRYYFNNASKDKVYGLQNIYNVIRRLAMNGQYTSIDMVNAHPNLLSQLCAAYNVECTKLNNYITNRNKYINDIMDNFDVSREVAKKFFLIACYGGTFNTWYKDNQKNKIVMSKSKPTAFMSAFIDELKAICKEFKNNIHIAKHYVKFINVATEVKHKEGCKSDSSALALLLQEMESKVLACMINFMEKKKIKIGALVHDELLVYNNKKIKDKMLIDLSRHVKNELGINMKFEMKNTTPTEDDIKWYESHLPFVRDIKEYKPITQDIKTINKKECNEKYVSECLSYDEFKQNNTIIAQSCTGTGKTTAIAKYVKQYMEEEKGYKFLSLTNLRSLSAQHTKSFADIKMKNYQDISANELNNKKVLTICLNSLHKLRREYSELQLKLYHGGKHHDFYLEKYIVYIDEINSFLELTHNSTLDNNLQETFLFLRKLIRNAHKVIVSDAMISDAVFKFLDTRPDESKIYIKNNFKKYQGIKAYRIRNEENFVDKVLNECLGKKAFTIGADSATEITRIYHMCLSKIDDPNERKRFKLFTAKEADSDVTDAQEQFTDNYIFYSPKIVTAVDFNPYEAQNVYIYNKGNSITPAGVYQQATRCRNIKELFYYSECKKTDYKFKNIDELKQHLKTSVQFNNDNYKKMYNMCSIIDKDDNLTMIENAYFELFAYNEYVRDTYNSNKTKHFEQILIDNGFVLCEYEGDSVKKLTKKQKKEMDGLVQEASDELFNEYIHASDRTLKKYENIHANVEFLKLPDEALIEYKDYILNDKKKQEYVTFLKGKAPTNVIKQKVADMKNTTFDVKIIKSVDYKVMIIRDIEEMYGMQPFQVDFKCEKFKPMKKEFFNHVSSVFSSKRKNPTNINQFMSLYVSLIRSVYGYSLVYSSQSMKAESRKQRIYELNKDLIRYEYMYLNKYTNPKLKNYHEYFINEYQNPDELEFQIELENKQSEIFCSNEELDTSLLDVVV